MTCTGAAPFGQNHRSTLSNGVPDMRALADQMRTDQHVAWQSAQLAALCR